MNPAIFPDYLKVENFMSRNLLIVVKMVCNNYMKTIGLYENFPIRNKRIFDIVKKLTQTQTVVNTNKENSIYTDEKI